MSMRLPPSRFLTVLNVLALCVIFVDFFKGTVAPAVAQRAYRDQYKELMFKCDNVMRDQFIAKRRVLSAPSDEAIRTLHASDVGLSTCHDYDVLRKRLIAWGVTENDLAKLGLEAIEERGKDVRFFVENHEIRY
jgi:hypothetical protein